MQKTAEQVWLSKSHSALIPERLPKPLQPFHGITLDDQIIIPSLNGSSAQKLRLNVRRRAERREQLGAHHSHVLSSFSLLLLLFSLEEVEGEEDRLFSI